MRTVRSPTGSSIARAAMHRTLAPHTDIGMSRSDGLLRHATKEEPEARLHGPGNSCPISVIFTSPAGSSPNRHIAVSVTEYEGASYVDLIRRSDHGGTYPPTLRPLATAGVRRRYRTANCRTPRRHRDRPVGDCSLSRHRHQ